MFNKQPAAASVCVFFVLFAGSKPATVDCADEQPRTARFGVENRKKNKVCFADDVL